ncbi:coiled-coil domain-containing protein [Paratractidigestivibacter faecalis]|uniref:coiled-coil domain-containing protein n=1 Tax=Paratractidigestivibacter faecalis TaxID=2292441 RepID=UPI003F9C7DAF
MSRKRIDSSEVGLTPRTVTRRDALRILIGAGMCAVLSPVIARAATTQEKLDAAQLSYDEAQSKLDQIGQEYSAIADQLSQTQAQVGDLSSQIDAKQAEIEQKQTEIDAKQAEVEAKQQQLGDRMCSAYKSGGSSVLDILLSSATFEELTSNIYYLDKISAADQAMISEVKDLKAELERQKSSLETEKAELESQKSELETLQAQQEQQLEEAQAKQAEAQDLVSNLSSEVKELMAQRDAELLAAQQAAEEAARREEERRKAAAAANKNNGSSGGSSSGGSQTITGNGSLAAVQSAAYSVPSPGSGLCAAWVTRVFAAAGLNVGGGNACDMYNWYCYTSVSNIQPGMIVACPSAPYSSAAVIYGHVGIYLGNNTVRDNASGRLRTSSLSAWVSEYSVTSTVRCGWLGGVALS